MDTNPIVSASSGQGVNQQPTAAPVNHTTAQVPNEANAAGTTPDITRYTLLVQQAITQNPNPHEQALAIAEIKKQYLKLNFNVDLPSVSADSGKM